jgi:hypothetical protein
VDLHPADPVCVAVKRAWKKIKKAVIYVVETPWILLGKYCGPLR